MLRIDVPREALAAFSRRHHIRRLAFFGSVLRDDLRPDGDRDLPALITEFKRHLSPPA